MDPPPASPAGVRVKDDRGPADASGRAPSSKPKAAASAANLDQERERLKELQQLVSVERESLQAERRLLKALQADAVQRCMPVGLTGGTGVPGSTGGGAGAGSTEAVATGVTGAGPVHQVGVGAASPVHQADAAAVGAASPVRQADAAAAGGAATSVMLKRKEVVERRGVERTKRKKPKRRVIKVEDSSSSSKLLKNTMVKLLVLSVKFK